MAATGEMLTESQIAALERKQDDDVAHGEIETAHPGYLGSQDTFYVGTIKGVDLTVSASNRASVRFDRDYYT